MILTMDELERGYRLRGWSREKLAEVINSGADKDISISYSDWHLIEPAVQGGLSLDGWNLAKADTLIRRWSKSHSKELSSTQGVNMANKQEKYAVALTYIRNATNLGLSRTSIDIKTSRIVLDAVSAKEALGSALFLLTDDTMGYSLLTHAVTNTDYSKPNDLLPIKKEETK